MLPCLDRGLRISDTDGSTGGIEAGIDGGIDGWIGTCNVISRWGTGSAVLLQQFPMNRCKSLVGAQADHWTGSHIYK